MFTILVVDNEVKIQKTYKDLFENEGYEVVLCSNVVDARKHLNSITIDLIILGIRIGEREGDILYDEAKTFHKDVKIIISSILSVEDQRKYMSKAEDYHNKSEGTRILLSKVRSVLNNDRKRKTRR